MIITEDIPSLKPRRPRWLISPPLLEFDFRASTRLFHTLQEVLDVADQLAAGQVFALRIDYEPVLLCRILARKGFTQWIEENSEDGMRIQFLRLASS